jgi:hypothetical protein
MWKRASKIATQTTTRLQTLVQKRPFEVTCVAVAVGGVTWGYNVLHPNLSYRVDQDDQFRTPTFFLKNNNWLYPVTIKHMNAKYMPISPRDKYNDTYPLAPTLWPGQILSIKLDVNSDLSWNSIRHVQDKVKQEGVRVVIATPLFGREYIDVKNDLQDWL